MPTGTQAGNRVSIGSVGYKDMQVSGVCVLLPSFTDIFQYVQYISCMHLPSLTHIFTKTIIVNMS